MPGLRDDSIGVPSAYGGAMTADPRVLGVTGASLLAVFAMLADDAVHAPTLADRAALTAVASQLGTRLDELGGAPGELAELSAPHLGLLDDIQARTAPGDWWERLMRSHIVTSMLMDLVRTMAADASPDVRRRVEAAAASSGHGDFAVGRLREGIGEEESLAARLSLWGRRVAGEVLGASEGLRGHGPRDAAGEQLAHRHSRRMARLGLTA